jgi:hypothetical protein
MAQPLVTFEVDWKTVLSTLGSTAIVVAAVGFIARTITQHVFRRDLETHKSNLKRETDLEIANAKASVDRELAAAKAQTDAALLAQKAEFDRQMETFKADVVSRVARADRIHAEIIHWANPILSAVMDLKRRLENVLENEGYLALSADNQNKLSAQWSIDYNYFFPSTVFIFCQYFCWIRLLEERLNFEIFTIHGEKDQLFALIRTFEGLAIT